MMSMLVIVYCMNSMAVMLGKQENKPKSFFKMMMCTQILYTDIFVGFTKTLHVLNDRASLKGMNMS